jgi:hypothetical protein
VLYFAKLRLLIDFEISAAIAFIRRKNVSTPREVYNGEMVAMWLIRFMQKTTRTTVFLFTSGRVNGSDSYSLKT